MKSKNLCKRQRAQICSLTGRLSFLDWEPDFIQTLGLGRETGQVSLIPPRIKRPAAGQVRFLISFFSRKSTNWYMIVAKKAMMTRARKTKVKLNTWNP